MSHKRMSRMSFKIKVHMTEKRMNFAWTILLGTELVFIVYPHTIALMDWSTLWAVLFFFMVITLGIDSTVSLVSFESARHRTHSRLVRWSWIDYHRSMWRIPECLWSKSSFIRPGSADSMLSRRITHVHLRRRLYCHSNEWNMRVTSLTSGGLCWMHCSRMVLR